jgi:tRNA-splicing ligase RtcB (3'-phosphate/5'-hydroxy nucleic acid ligase)
MRASLLSAIFWDILISFIKYFKKIKNKNLTTQMYCAVVIKSLQHQKKKIKMINGKALLDLGFSENKALGAALEAAATHLTAFNDAQILTKMKKILKKPAAFLEDAAFATVAQALLDAEKLAENAQIPLKIDPLPYSIFGADQIDGGAIEQMNIAMRLPVTAGGALMPDAHKGYGLPIGGVLATRNAVIPFGVGVDIGCRMALSVFDISEAHFDENRSFYKRELIAQTVFGAGNGFQGNHRSYHNVLDRKEFGLNKFIHNLKDKAFTQLGSSGGGNHFAEFGILDFAKFDAPLGIPKGRYLALLTHSGSRGFGATVAGYYTKLAKDLCKLPPEAANLAYLSLDSEAGIEYWAAMNLAGDYASACHEVIHRKMTRAIGAEVLTKVENHHNFAWKEQLNGEEVIVHRKGATPAAAGVMGIIPGSMTAPGFLVRGKGFTDSLNSASHGAGRAMSRTAATKNITKAEMKAILQENNVMLIGAGLDEAPMAYKNIHKVMAAQTDLVDVVAQFTPKMVRMADDGSRED